MQNGRLCVSDDVYTFWDSPQPNSSSSTLTVDFSWEFSDCFEIRPKSGSLAPKQDVKFVATFSPQCARVYDAVATCNYGDDKRATKSMRVEGVGRYPHVLVRLAKPNMSPLPKGRDVVVKELGAEGVEEEGVAQSKLVVNFGRVPVGNLSERLVEIVNMSPVRERERGREREREREREM